MHQAADLAVGDRRLRQRSSWSTYGYMQADVLPVPTAPRIMTPV